MSYDFFGNSRSSKHSQNNQKHTTKGKKGGGRKEGKSAFNKLLDCRVKRYICKLNSSSFSFHIFRNCSLYILKLQAAVLYLDSQTATMKHVNIVKKKPLRGRPIAKLLTYICFTNFQTKTLPWNPMSVLICSSRLSQLQRNCLGAVD